MKIMKKMNFQQLCEFWTDPNSNKEIVDMAEKHICYSEFPGGLVVSNKRGSVYEINDDIAVKIVGFGQTGWDTTYVFTPVSDISRAARIAAYMKKYNVSRLIVTRALKTRFGVELLRSGIDFNEFYGVLLRPNLTKFGGLSNALFDKWIEQCAVSYKNAKILRSLSGPRKESVVEIVLGKDWKTRCFPVD